jgi:hypothetical protein
VGTAADAVLAKAALAASTVAITAGRRRTPLIVAGKRSPQTLAIVTDATHAVSIARQ